MDRIDILRHRIALYRRYLREGATASEASEYLKQIQKDAAELAALIEEGRDAAGGEDPTEH